jgi:hypothetical protein
MQRFISVDITVRINQVSSLLTYIKSYLVQILAGTLDIIKSALFWDITLFCFPPFFTLVPCSTHYLTLKMEAICSSETSVDFQQITQCYIPEGSTLHNHHHETLRSHMLAIMTDIFRGFPEPLQVNARIVH